MHGVQALQKFFDNLTSAGFTPPLEMVMRAEDYDKLVSDRNSDRRWITNQTQEELQKAYDAPFGYCYGKYEINFKRGK